MPWGCAIQVRPTPDATKNIVADDVPWNESPPTICNAVDSNYRYLYGVRFAGGENYRGLTNSKRETKPAEKRFCTRATIQCERLVGVTTSPPDRKSSSKTNGKERARPNGQPIIAPAANNKATWKVRRLFFMLAGSRAYVNARVVVYMTNEDGRNAEKCKKGYGMTSGQSKPAVAIHMPVLNKSMKNK